ncbi:substrate-binding domain-containing protein [Mastigocladopsis repens]|nr:substrate-binding domain-containing protein [Mastigocladopsis repens]
MFSFIRVKRPLHIPLEKSHSPVVYPVAVVKNSKNATAAKAFVQFLKE